MNVLITPLYWYSWACVGKIYVHSLLSMFIHKVFSIESISSVRGLVLYGFLDNNGGRAFTTCSNNDITSYGDAERYLVSIFGGKSSIAVSLQSI